MRRRVHRFVLRFPLARPAVCPTAPRNSQAATERLDSRSTFPFPPFQYVQSEMPSPAIDSLLRIGASGTAQKSTQSETERKKKTYTNHRNVERFVCIAHRRRASLSVSRSGSNGSMRSGGIEKAMKRFPGCDNQLDADRSKREKTPGVDAFVCLSFPPPSLSVARYPIWRLFSSIRSAIRPSVSVMPSRRGKKLNVERHGDTFPLENYKVYLFARVAARTDGTADATAGSSHSVHPIATSKCTFRPIDDKMNQT